MLRSILAVVAGYLACVLGVTTLFSFVVFVLLGGHLGDPGAFHPPRWLYAFEIVASGIVAAMGGYVCAWIARRRPLRHAWALVAVMIVMGVISAVGEAGLKPLWSSVAVSLVSCAGVLAGARLRVLHAQQ